MNMILKKYIKLKFISTIKNSILEKRTNYVRDGFSTFILKTNTYT